MARTKTKTDLGAQPEGPRAPFGHPPARPPRVPAGPGPQARRRSRPRGTPFGSAPPPGARPRAPGVRLADDDDDAAAAAGGWAALGPAPPGRGEQPRAGPLPPAARPPAGPGPGRPAPPAQQGGGGSAVRLTSGRTRRGCRPASCRPPRGSAERTEALPAGPPPCRRASPLRRPPPPRTHLQQHRAGPHPHRDPPPAGGQHRHHGTPPARRRHLPSRRGAGPCAAGAELGPGPPLPAGRAPPRPAPPRSAAESGGRPRASLPAGRSRGRLPAAGRRLPFPECGGRLAVPAAPAAKGRQRSGRRPRPPGRKPLPWRRERDGRPAATPARPRGGEGRGGGPAGGEPEGRAAGGSGSCWRRVVFPPGVAGVGIGRLTPREVKRISSLCLDLAWQLYVVTPPPKCEPTRPADVAKPGAQQAAYARSFFTPSPKDLFGGLRADVRKLRQERSSADLSSCLFTKQCWQRLTTPKISTCTRQVLLGKR